MKFFRFIGYFSQLRALIGLRAACSFSLVHMWNKFNPPHDDKLARVPVGKFVFYFPSIDYFTGLFTEIFFKETYFIPYTNEPIRVIDCGANIGVSLLYIKTRAPHAHVTCFEPNPDARAVLLKNVAANNWSAEVQVLPYALGKEKGTVDFFVEKKVATSSGGSTMNHGRNKERSAVSYTVEVDTLSPYLSKPVDLLKMDIEGGEFDVLDELVAQNVLHNIVSLQLEYHYFPTYLTRPVSDILTLLEANGFKTFTQPTALPHQIVGRDVTHAYMIFAWR